MKTSKTVLILLLSVFVVQYSNAQIDLGDFFGVDKEEKPITNDELNRELVHPDDDFVTLSDLNEFFGGGDNLLGNSDGINKMNLFHDQVKNQKFAEEFETALNQKFKNWMEISNGLDNFYPQTKCLYLMAKYMKAFEEIVALTEATGDCKMKYELYGQQLIMMMSSTQLMFCTEEMYNNTISWSDVQYDYTSQEAEDIQTYFQEMWDDLFEINAMAAGTREVRNPDFYYTDFGSDFVGTMLWWFAFSRITFVESPSVHGFELANLQTLLEKYFHPMSLIPQALEISQRMTELKPCAGL